MAKISVVLAPQVKPKRLAAIAASESVVGDLGDLVTEIQEELDAFDGPPASLIDSMEHLDDRHFSAVEDKQAKKSLSEGRKALKELTDARKAFDKAEKSLKAFIANLELR